MIDYLELLLERQEREEPEETLEWEQNVSAVRKRTAVSGGARAGNDAIPGTRDGIGPVSSARSGEQPEFLMRVPAAEAAAWTAGTGPVISGVQTRSIKMPGVTDGSETAGFDIYETADAGAGLKQTETGSAVSLFRTREAALSGGAGGGALSGAPGLYRQMARTGQAVGGLRYGTRLLTVAEGSSASHGLGAEELDELFSRDARRYDSGFSLF